MGLDMYQSRQTVSEAVCLSGIKAEAKLISKVGSTNESQPQQRWTMETASCEDFVRLHPSSVFAELILDQHEERLLSVHEATTQVKP